MLKNILFATDLSGDSAHAVGWLRWFCDHYDSNAFIIHVLNLPPFGLNAAEIAQARSLAARRFDQFIRKHHLNQKTFTQELVVGDPAITITAFVAKHDIELLVLSNRAAGLNRVLSGSVSEEVFRSVDCPVVIVGPHAKSPRGVAGISRVFFPTDLARRSKSVLSHFDFLFEGDPSPKLTVAHFLSTESMSIVERHKTRKSLQAKLVDLVPDEVRRQLDDVVVESCPPVRGILEFSREGRCDLIVLAVKDAGPLTRAATHQPRSITHQIIRSATCPVLTIRV
jgi:nucleotide-binding universal stress UspA family protein